MGITSGDVQAEDQAGQDAAGQADQARQDRAPIVVTAGRFAALVGVHHNTVTNWLREGLPCSREGDAGRGRAQIDVGAGFRWLLDRERARTKDARESVTEDGAKAQKLAAEARLKELDLEEREGKLIAADDVEATWSQTLVAIRESVISIAGNAVQSSIVPPAKEAELEELCREALTAIGDQMRAGGGQ